MLVFDDELTKVHALSLGPIRTNTYIVESSGECFLIDPVGEAEKILSYLKANHLRPQFLFATHGHFDHIAAAQDLLDGGYGSCLYVHPLDRRELQNAKTMSLMIAKKPFRTPHFQEFDDELASTFHALGFQLQLLPGHTKGSSVLFRSDRKILFSGDLIINNLVVNEMPNPGEDTRALFESIQIIRESFKPETLIFPGHGPLTKLETELRFNKMIQYARLQHG